MTRHPVDGFALGLAHVCDGKPCSVGSQSTSHPRRAGHNSKMLAKCSPPQTNQHTCLKYTRHISGGWDCHAPPSHAACCLLYTSDAADDTPC
eukprot:1441167-Amphidinium_carterae.1